MIAFYFLCTTSPFSQSFYGIRDMPPQIRLIVCSSSPLDFLPSSSLNFSSAWSICLLMKSHKLHKLHFHAEPIKCRDTGLGCALISSVVNPSPRSRCSPVATNVIALNQWDELWDFPGKGWRRAQIPVNKLSKVHMSCNISSVFFTNLRVLLEAGF